MFEAVPKSAYTTGSVNTKDSGCLFSNHSKPRRQYQHQPSAQTATGLCFG